MLDDFFGPGSEFIKILNAYGLGLLGVGLVLLFRSLQARTDSMKELLSTLKEKHDSTITTLEKRAQVLAKPPASNRQGIFGHLFGCGA